MGPESSIALHRDTEREVQRHRNLQEGITDDLVELAARLKENTRQLETSVAERGSLLDIAEDNLVKSSLGLDQSMKQQKQVKKRCGDRAFGEPIAPLLLQPCTVIARRSWIGLCARLSLILFVALTFVGVLVFIRLTSMAGYKARPRVRRGKDEL